MTDHLNFKVSSELKNILGRDLITSPDIAILELVKNSYDAHANNVEIIFDDDYLSIADNGKGMSKGDLVDKWLFVAYSAKSDGTEDISYRSKFKRHYAGAKGIGRMSCDRLAKKLTLTTRSFKENKTEILNVDWSVFEHDRLTEFDTVKIPHETVDYVPKFPLNKQTGTILEFRDLNVSWSRDEILRLKKSLEKMINPFSGTDDEFQIEIIAPKMKEEDENTDSTYEKVNGIIKNTIADVLKIKSTQIESRIENGIIHTTLYDRGIKMYEIEENNILFSSLSSVSISLFYLNRAAKYSFTAKMGIEPVNYGNVFLFRNGFRIFPFGEFKDDSWGLNQRVQQGYNRFLGTRDLFGRVDVETDDVDLIKEVSSRDGGLIQTKASKQLMDYFTLIHRRLERYVVGVLWGEGFLRKDYFVDQNSAYKARKQLQENEKDSETSEHLYDNIGSKVDFLQLVKSLVNDKSINVVYYNENLANIVSDASETEMLQTQMLNDVRNLAKKTNDVFLLGKLKEFEKHLDVIRSQKEEAEKKAERERIAKEEAERKAEVERKAKEEAERKAREEEKKRIEAENELKQKTKQNLFLQSVGNVDVDRILKYHHDIRIHSGTITNSLNRLLKLANKEYITKEDIIKYSELISRANSKIMAIAKFATKANFNTDGDDIEADIIEYIEQYINTVLPEFYDDKKLECITNGIHKVITFKPLEVSLMIDNLLSNSFKANASLFSVVFRLVEDYINIEITDDGIGIDQSIENPDTIFEKGVTTTNGSGLGLYNVSCYIKKELSGSIELDKTFVSERGKGSGCKIIIKLKS